MQLENYKGNIKTSLKIRDFKGNKTNSIKNKGQTKDFKRRRRLSRLYNNNNSLKIAHI